MESIGSAVRCFCMKPLLAICILMIATNMSAKSPVLLDFSNSEQTSAWFPVNDSVMGGVSNSSLTHDPAGFAVFSGNLSLDNNGGFASVRLRFETLDANDYTGIEIKVKGDGKRYQLRLRDSQRWDGVAHVSTFDSSENWQTIQIPFSSLVPQFRGRTVRNTPEIDTNKISQLSFMVSDKQSGQFHLHVDSIRLY